MKAWSSAEFVLPLPQRHRFPMRKYDLLRRAVAARPDLAELCTAPAATDEQLCAAHEAEYVQRVVRGTLSAHEIRAIGFPWSVAMVERSRRSTGATLAAARSALVDGVGVNLAGGTHHAGPGRGAGYCVFNDSAVALRTLLAQGEIDVAAVIDTDVHQGDGTAEIFAEDRRVFTVSLHGARNYPFRKKPSDLDIPLETGTTDSDYLDALDTALDFVVRTSPDLVIFLSGADSHVDDTLGHLSLTTEGLRERDRRVFSLLRGASIPVAVTMGGGYNKNLDTAVRIHTQTVFEAARFA